MSTVSFQNPLKFYKEMAQKDTREYQIDFTVKNEQVRGGWHILLKIGVFLCVLTNETVMILIRCSDFILNLAYSL